MKKQKFVYGCDFKMSCQSHPLLRVCLNVCVNIFRLFVGLHLKKGVKTHTNSENMVNF